jgi:hypothetical protein
MPLYLKVYKRKCQTPFCWKIMKEMNDVRKVKLEDIQLVYLPCSLCPCDSYGKLTAGPHINMLKCFSSFIPKKLFYYTLHILGINECMDKKSRMQLKDHLSPPAILSKHRSKSGFGTILIHSPRSDRTQKSQELAGRHNCAGYSERITIPPRQRWK